MNNVVIGDLSKYKADACMLFDGVDDFVRIENMVDFTEIKATFKIKEITLERQYIIDSSPGLYGFLLYTIGNGVVLYCYDLRTTPIKTEVLDCIVRDSIIDIKVNIYSDKYVIDVNGVVVEQLDFIGPVRLPLDGVTTIGSNVEQTSFSEIKMLRASINNNFAFDFSDFGATVVEDNSGNGNDGTINGAKWWKQGVDENFLTPQLYKSTWDDPMADDQNVVAISSVDYIDEGDSFWSPYNSDSTFMFSVLLQENGVSALLKMMLFNGIKGESEMIATLKLNTVGTGIVKVYSIEHLRHPSFAKSNAGGTLVVKYQGDDDFTEITLDSSGMFLPIGEIAEVDLDLSTASVDDVVLGY